MAAAAPAPRPAAHSAHARRGDEISLRDLAAIVTITPEDRPDIAVEVFNPGPLPTPQVRASGRGMIVDGDLSRSINSCRGPNGAFAVNIDRRGWVDQARLPVVNIRAPQSFALAAGGALKVTVGPAEALHVATSACGEVELTTVRGAADIAVSGRGVNLRLVEAGEAELRVAGAGDIELGLIRDGLALSIAGAGDVTAQRVDGPTNIAIQGAGDVTIRDGRASTLSVAIAGAGDVRHGGAAERLDAVILGAGDISVKRVEGEVSRRILGVGSISVDNR